MKGFILVNAYSKNEEYLYQANRLKEEFAIKGVNIDIIEGGNHLLYIENNNIKVNISEYDFCIFWDKDKYVLEMLEKIGMPTFNSNYAISMCSDKMLTHIALADKGIPMPKTYAGLLCYLKDAEVKPEMLDFAETLGYPLVIKESYGSLGKGVYLANNREELSEIMEKVKCKPHIIQEFIKTSYGRDVRVIVIGGEVVGGMLRQGNNDFRSNIGAGGTGEVFPLTEEMKQLALKVSDALGLDYCGMDMLFGENGPIICEVNSNALFCAFEKVTKINVAKKYVEYILNKINKN